MSITNVCIGLGGVTIKALVNIKPMVFNDTKKNQTVYM